MITIKIISSFVNKTIPLLALLLILSCGKQAKNTERNSNQNKIPNFTKTFAGNINSDIEIIMTLTKNEDKLSGTYTYISQGKPMKLNGTMDSDGNLTLDEFNDKGSISGKFTGQYKSPNITGNWSKPDGSRTMPFFISETDKSEASFTKKEDNFKTDWTGKYFDKYESSLIIKGPNNKGAVEFELFQASEHCEGSGINGIAYLTKSNVAQYTEKYGICEVILTFNSDNIYVEEFNCEDYHGARCGLFNGVYNRR